jgi:hypothetical protein
MLGKMTQCGFAYPGLVNDVHDRAQLAAEGPIGDVGHSARLDEPLEWLKLKRKVVDKS